MEVNENKLLVEPISGEEEVIEWSSSEANVDTPMRGAMLKLSSLPVGVTQEMIKEVLLGLSAPVYFVDVYSDNTALIRLCHDNGARMLLDKLKNGKIFIDKKSVQVSALEQGEEDEFLPKPKDDIHYFWKSLGTVKAKEQLPSFNSRDLCCRYGLDRRNEANECLSIPKSCTAIQQKSSVPSGCRPKSNDSTKPSTKRQQISKLSKTFSDWSDERSGRIHLDYQYGKKNGNPVAADYYSFKNTADHIPKDDQAIRGSFPAVDDEAFARESVVEYCTYLPLIATPTAGSRVSIKVSNVPNSFRFYCALSASAEILLAHQLDIQKEYNENHQLHRVALNPSAVDFVVARSPSNKIWYRARILQELDNDVFAVYFIDFGHEKVVLKSDVCVLLTRFTYLPMQAVEMFLQGVDRKANSEKARNELMSLVKGKDLDAYINSDDPELLVDLYDTSEGKQVDIARELNRRIAIEETKCRKYDPYRGVKFIPG